MLGPVSSSTISSTSISGSLGDTFILSAVQGVYTLTGKTAALNKTLTFPAGSGTYYLTGGQFNWTFWQRGLNTVGVLKPLRVLQPMLQLLRKNLPLLK